ncbi:MAG TPA: hypothetical protein VHK69_02620 [Chitinophagaceae bacterium]|nr:hypothetical protein [Chitinophagaceae bacterium]
MTRNLRLFFVLLIKVLIAASVSATNYTNSGNSAAYNLASGDTLRIVSGNYRGNVNAFPAGAVIRISGGATFTPNSLSNPGGIIINYGTAVLNFYLTTGAGFRAENYGIFTINGGLTMNGAQNWNNYLGGTLTIGAVIMQGNIFNEGNITLNGDLTINSGTLTNRNRITSNGGVTISNGTIQNEGRMNPTGLVTINAGVTYTNTCHLIPRGGLRNNGTLRNSGLLWLGSSGSTSTEFSNNGTVTSLGGVVKAERITNSNVLNGRGSYYFTGQTTSSGTVGTTGSTTDTLRFYDATRTNPLTLFDMQAGFVRPNAVFRTLPPPDTVHAYSGCAAAYTAITVLPLRITAWAARWQRETPVLSWSAAPEAGTRFVVERSVDGRHFLPVDTLEASPSGSYNFTDASAPAATAVLYYRLQVLSSNDTRWYSEVRALHPAGVAPAAIQCFPNPVRQKALLKFQTGEKGPAAAEVRSLAGTLIARIPVHLDGTPVQVELSGAGSWPTGIYLVTVLREGRAIAAGKFTRQ